MALPGLEALDSLLVTGEVLSATGAIAPATLVGLPPAGRALALLALSGGTDRPIALITRSDADAESICGDLRSFGRLTERLAPDQISLFPALDADPYDGLSSHLGVVCRRVRALWRLRRGRTRVLVIPARALMIPLPPLSLLDPFFVEVTEDGPFEQADEPLWFVEAGYRRADLVTEPGEYSRRGGILDIYPPTLDEPVRIELEGSRVVSLRRFNPADQRSTGRPGSVTLAPARETIMGAAERDNLAAAIRDNAAGRRLREQLQTQGQFPGMSACARVIYPKASGILEQLASAAAAGPVLLACDELEMTSEALRQERAGFIRAAEAAGDTAEALPPPDRLLTPEEEIGEALAGASIRLRHLDIEEDETTSRLRLRFAAAGMPSYRGRLADLMTLIRDETGAGRRVWVVMQSEGRTHRMRSLLQENDLAAAEPGETEGRLFLATARISGGLSLPAAGLTIIAEQEIFGEEVRHRKKSALPTFTSDFRDLNPGDLVVHVDHGVGLYEGLSRVSGDGQEVDVMVLSYNGGDKLFVPATRLDLVQKYSGVGNRAPTLDKLGGTGWVRTKQRVRKAMQDMAAELLNLYAARKTVTGHAFGSDTEWQRDFETAFPYELTLDQQIAVNDIKRDLETDTPMDRLLCGDVGFGKTEVALRAAFKVVMEGRQVAVLAPTTVLVFQHLNTFRERFAAFPARIESLSRFKTPKEQKAIVAGLATGAVDIVIGTHRMLSKDIAFKDLGLLVVDEEQRFGVAHKERIKKLKKNVDVLTLSATPIPRTLQMSLMGVRDLSVIETPPENRLAIQTHLVPFKDPIIASAIRHELERDGQVYFVHNRIDTVYAMASHIQKLVPEVKATVAHGQMPEHQLEDAMLSFLRGESNVLVSTTIIENGLDIPRVNTLLVNRADQFGLAQLYQLRGRIGRSDRQAYAYLMVPPERTLTEVARKRLKALQEFSQLGSGFRIAAMDLEIRGAGNLLGPAQHGHIAALGFELYCRMLERAVQDLRSGGEEVVESRASINLAVDLKIPESYIADEHHRLMFYKRIASAASGDDLHRIRDEMEDRYGRLPRQGMNLLQVAELRVLAEPLGVLQADYRSAHLVVKFGESSPVEPERLLRLVGRRDDATFSPPAVLRIKGERSEAERLALAREILVSLA